MPACLPEQLFCNTFGCFAFFAQLASNFRTERLMNATLQSFRTESDLPQHRRGNFSVDRFAAVRRAGERDLSVR